MEPTDCKKEAPADPVAYYRRWERFIQKIAYHSAHRSGWAPTWHKDFPPAYRRFIEAFYLCHRFSSGDSVGARAVRRGFSKDLVRCVLELMHFDIPREYRPVAATYGQVAGFPAADRWYWWL